MADDFYILSKSWTYGALATATGTGINGTVANNARDYKFATYWENDDAVPAITFDFNDATLAVDSIWFQSTNVATYELQYSTDGAIFNTVFTAEPGNADGFNFKIGFTKQTARFWKLAILSRTVGGNPIRIHECQLMELKLNVSDVNDRPSRYARRALDVGHGGYRLADGNLVAYEGLSERGKSDIEIEWEFLQRSVKNTLKSIWEGPPKQPILTLFPEPVDEPGEIFQAKWENGFDFRYSASHTGQGYSGRIEMSER